MTDWRLYLTTPEIRERVREEWNIKGRDTLQIAKQLGPKMPEAAIYNYLSDWKVWRASHERNNRVA
jgi:hypothetical protein